MAIGDILAGLGEASHQHHQNVLQMEYQKKRELAHLYGQLSQDPNYPEHVRSEALKRAVTIHSLEPGKKLPKDIEGMTFTYQPQAPTINIPGSEGTNAQSVQLPGGEQIAQYAQAGIEPRTIQGPTPPPQQASFAPIPFAEMQQRALQAKEAEYALQDKYRPPQEVSPGASLVKDGQAIYTAPPAPAKPPEPPAPFSLSRGQMRFDPTGREIARNDLAEETNITTAKLAWEASDHDPAKAMAMMRQQQQATEPGSFMPIMAPDNTIIGAWNAKSGRFVPAPFEGARRTGIPAGVNKEVAEYENAARKIAELGTAYKPEFVGPYEGRYEKSKASGILSYLPFLRTPEGYPEFAALSADLQNSIIKLITGAQMGQQEAQRILRQVPTENDKDENWSAKYQQTQANAQFLLGRIKELQGLGSNAPTVPPTGGSDMIRVQIPGQPIGSIPRSALQQFMKDHPNATQVK